MDTAYPGFLMIPTQAYDEAFLSITELPEDKFGVYRTVVGLVEVKRAWAHVEIPDVGFVEDVIVETPRYVRFDRTLVGRGLLARYEYLLRGPASQGCIL